jgi:inner membrane protein
VAALVGAVVGLDLLWSVVVGSTGSIAYGFVDLPAHVAACAVALLAVLALPGPALSRRFVGAALIASVAIDIDHIPGYLGSHVVTGSLPRPYAHSVLLVALLVAIGAASRRRDARQVMFGIAFGVSAHLLRDLATGPGVPLLWPLSNSVASLPYAVYAGLLVGAAAGVAVMAPHRSPRRRRARARLDARPLLSAYPPSGS